MGTLFRSELMNDKQANNRPNFDSGSAVKRSNIKFPNQKAAVHVL